MGPEPATDVDDSEVMRQCEADPALFATLFDRYFVPLHGYAARRLGGPGADDVAAETFLVAFRDRDRYDPGRGSVRAWLYGIATNLIRAHWRAEIRGYRAHTRAAAEPAYDIELDRAEGRLAAATAYQRLIGVLADLSSGDRDVLTLVVWGELSHEEAAAALDIPVGTVGSRLFRVRQKLRAQLDTTHRSGR